MNAYEWDGLLRSALLEAQRLDWAEQLEGEPPEPEFSPGYRRRRERLLRDPFAYGKRRARPLWRRALKTAACLLLAAGIALGGLLAASPTVRAWFWKMILESSEEFSRFTLAGEEFDFVNASCYRPAYVPEGFEIVDEWEEAEGITITYMDTGGQKIVYDSVPLAAQFAFVVDNEHSDSREITFNGLEATLMISNAEGWPNYVIWANGDSKTAYCLMSTIEYEELILMAESVEKQTLFYRKEDARFRLGYIPEGYEPEANRGKQNHVYQLTYWTPMRDFIEFSYEMEEYADEVQFEDDDTEQELVRIGDTFGVLCRGRYDMKELIWMDEQLGIACKLRAKLPLEELVRIAERIESTP